jgi:hypothetical protein
MDRSYTVEEVGELSLGYVEEVQELLDAVKWMSYSTQGFHLLNLSFRKSSHKDLLWYYDPPF